MNSVTRLTIRPDPGFLAILKTVNQLSLNLVAIVGLVVLAGWLLPGIGSNLPQGWSVMQSTTAACALLSSLGMLFQHQENSLQLRRLSRVILVGVLLIASIVLIEHKSGITTGIATLWVADSMQPLAYTMSLQSAVSFSLLALAMLIPVTRQDWLGGLLDGLILLLLIFNLIFIAAYLFGALQLIGTSQVIRLSPQTLLCILLLTFMLTNRRAPYGFFALLVAGGISGHFARAMLPVSIGVTFLFILVEERLFSTGVMSIAYAASVTSTAMASLLIIILIMMARKINNLEGALHQQLTTDELTGINNRRGFYLLAEQALWDAYRNRRQLTLLFFDLDVLKQVNDKLGHNVGSQFIQEMARLLRDCFRKSDILGRLGGDEFAVLAHGQQNKTHAMLAHLNLAVEAVNLSRRHPFTIAFSVGCVKINPLSAMSLDDLLAQADAAMYRNKRDRHANCIHGQNIGHLQSTGCQIFET